MLGCSSTPHLEATGGAALQFTWTTDAVSPEALEGLGYEVLSLRTLQRSLIKQAKLAGPHRTGVRNASHRVLELMTGARPLAVVDVDLSDPASLSDLYNYCVVPCYHGKRDLLVQAREELLELSPDAFLEQEIGYAWTLQRLRYLFDSATHKRDNLVAGNLGRPASADTGLDQYQRAAVAAGMGVTQIIAPAGSGKTLTLIARVRELLARGVEQDRILVTTFNAATARELKGKLGSSGIDRTAVHTFHALGRRILSEEKLLRGEIGDIGYRMWRLLCVKAKQQTGEWIEPADAKAAIEDLKLRRKGPHDISSEEGDTAETLRTLFRLYEAELERQSRDDHADLILKALDLLERSATARERWQARWECVLVDEYQDIEPIQEQLIRILAAPQDCLFVVGDEDQCIYSWRRADPTRIVQLDQVYPALERHVLQVSYRCPERVVSASSALITHNRSRFPKPITSDPARSDEGRVLVNGYASQQDMCAGIVGPLAQSTSYARAAILTRTRRLLKVAAVALHDAGVPFTTREGMLSPTPAEKTVLAYTRLVSASASATPEDVERVFEIPPTGLPDGAEATIARALREGTSFRSAVSKLRLADWQTAKVAARAEILDSLSHETSAGRVMARLLKDGGLEAYYRDAEKMSPANMDAVETLNQLALESSESASLEQFVTSFAARLAFFESGGDDAGYAIDTIHGAKGREWDTVVLFACDDDQMPHARALKETAGRSKTEILEEERRLAYVAFTRAKRTLVIAHTSDNPSRFLYEAGLLERPRPAMRPQPKPVPKPRPGARHCATRSDRGVRTAHVGKVHANRISGRLCGVCGSAIPLEGLMARVTVDDCDTWAHIACASGLESR